MKATSPATREHRNRCPWGRAALTMALAGSLTVGAAVAATADVTDEGPPPEPDGGITDQMVHDSVMAFDTAGSVRAFDPSDHIVSLGDSGEGDDGETVISLSSDLLFAENSWDLPANAPGKIAELVADIPDGATVQVTGHTDSQQPIGQDFDNQELSENRAEAVADALADERPDLDLDVSGAGESQPAVTEDPEDPSTFAANRRVEIIYEG